MKKIFMAMVLFIAVAGSAVQAQKVEVMTSTKEGWHKIGETTVNFKKDTDEILVIGENKFTELKFVVKETPIDIISLKLHFTKGADQNVKVNNPIEANGESHKISLTGGERKLQKIVFVYKTLPNRHDDKAHVEIWGYKIKK
ncbi:hypothetical protein [Flavobacterium sp. KJJ]|uniref:hypothetical protein n=1 Tax=Flavobacterium sp. KJJ TaxID=1270193 RepID=UPI0004933ED1|nr:hypothetical protein [Flavobacterium sp. KJJ]